MQAVGIGDLHLPNVRGQGALSSYIKDPAQMVQREVNRVLAWAKKRGIRRVFFYGDICEGTRMSYEGQLALLSILRQDFDFEIILGNHDLFSEDPELGHALQLVSEFALPNVRIHTQPRVLKLDGQRVKFLPWPYSDFDDRCLNVAHVDVQGAKTDSGREVPKDENGQRGKATAVVGHIHTRQRVRNTFYSGTLYQTNFGESADKWFHHIEYDDGWVVNDIKFKPEYVLHTVEVRKPRDLKAVPRSKKDLVKLILVDGCKLTAADTAGINVVMTKTVNGAQELALAHVSELKEGSQVEVSTDEFFSTWAESKGLDSKTKASVEDLRLQMLKRLDK